MSSTTEISDFVTSADIRRVIERMSAYIPPSCPPYILFLNKGEMEMTGHLWGPMVDVRPLVDIKV